jgi:hypothetical protein
MTERRPRGPWAWVLAGAGTLVMLFVLAAIFSLGPFRDEDLTGGGSAIAQGDEICREAHEAFAEREDRPPRTAAEAAQLTAQLIDIAGDEADRLGSLDGSPEFEAQIRRYVAAREQGIAAMRDGQAAAEHRDARAYEEAQAEVAANQRERYRIARRIGFGVCSRPLELG